MIETVISTRKKMSLLGICSTCNCCKSGSPIVSDVERECIITQTGNDYFTKVKTKNEESYFIIGKNKNGGLRDLSKDLCPYFSQEKKCTIQEVKPLDCVLYPIKPVYESLCVNPYVVVDTRCSASEKLSIEFYTISSGLVKKFLNQFTPSQLEHYITYINRWPLIHGKKLST